MGVRVTRLAGAALLMLLALPVAAQDVSSLSDRLDRLERDLGTLESQVYKGKTPPPGTAAPAATAPAGNAAVYNSLDDRITALEEALPKLTDQVERANFAATQLTNRLDRMQADNEFRFKALEAKTAAPTPDNAAATPTAPAPSSAESASGFPSSVVNSAAGADTLVHKDANGHAAAPAVAPVPAAVPGKNASEQYQYAFGLLRSNDYANAKSAFQGFLAQNPNDPLAGNATFWLGRIYFVQEDYDRAAVTFLDAYQKYPKSPKAAESLLNVGLSMANLGKKKEACAALRRFTTEFPDAADDLRRQANAEKHQQGCS